jgi:hypothetical protein
MNYGQAASSNVSTVGAAMLLARVLAGFSHWHSRVCALGLLLVLLTLLPLADAAPPDPLWIAGIYDEADFDEVVGAVVSASIVVGCILHLLERPADIPAGVARLHPGLVAIPAQLCAAFAIRAPPFRLGPRC